jgi:hypothetical protein
MVYMTPEDIGWELFLKSWMKKKVNVVATIKEEGSIASKGF